jgi:transcriptional regulator with XRE-family HTH domain
MTANKFKEIRVSMGLTQQALADKMHKTARSIRGYEGGTHPIPYLVEYFMRRKGV